MKTSGLVVGVGGLTVATFSGCSQLVEAIVNADAEERAAMVSAVQDGYADGIASPAGQAAAVVTPGGSQMVGAIYGITNAAFAWYAASQRERRREDREARRAAEREAAAARARLDVVGPDGVAKGL